MLRSQETPRTVVAADWKLPEAARIDYAQFRVLDAGKAMVFYRDLLGMKELGRDHDIIRLAVPGSSQPMILLHEDRQASQRPGHSAGLYHLALLYPDRKDLAAAFKRLYEHRWVFQGFADHGVSEALYMTDGVGNGIELYVDRPREQWASKNGRLEMVTEPLDLDGLLSELDNTRNRDENEKPLSIGHIHLQISDLQSGEEFYHHTLGFDVTQRTFPGALFLSAGGYHHHIGLNTWTSRGGSPMQDGVAGLEQFGLRLGNEEALRTLDERTRTTSHRNGETDRGILLRDSDNIQLEIF